MGLYENSSIIDDIKFQFRQGNMVTRLILVNVGVFLAIRIIHLFAFLFFQIDFGDFSDKFVRWFMAPADLKNLLYQPWSLFTYMFLHEGFLHILFNMIVLYIFGRILNDFLGNRKILPIYILGGFAGVLFYIITFNIFPVFDQTSAFMLGASAGVMAIMLATATLTPDYSIRLMFIGSVKLKYIALFFVLLDVITISQDNPGGHIAHLGGALFGFLFIKQLQQGNDWSLPFNKVADKITSLFSGRPAQPRVSYKSKNTKTANTATRGKAYHTKKGIDKDKQAKIDAILDKIADSGYDSLSKDEKAFLFTIRDK